MIYGVDFGYSQDTVIYALKPEALSHVKGETVDEIIGRLHHLGVKDVAIDPADPKIIEALQARGFNVLIAHFKFTHGIKLNHDMKKPTIEYSQYEPRTVEDEYGNQYLAINKYEAESIMKLITQLRKDKLTKYNTGDWWLDLPIKIRGFLKGGKDDQAN